MTAKASKSSSGDTETTETTQTAAVGSTAVSGGDVSGGDVTVNTGDTTNVERNVDIDWSGWTRHFEWDRD